MARADLPLSYSALAYSWIDPPIANSPFSIPLSQLIKAQNVGVYSAYRAAQLLLEGEDGNETGGGGEGKKHFIVTGNICHKEGHAWPAGFVLGLGKSGAAHLVEIGAKAYGRKGGVM